jgi:hypothetical protein
MYAQMMDGKQNYLSFSFDELERYDAKLLQRYYPRGLLVQLNDVGGLSRVLSKFGWMYWDYLLFGLAVLQSSVERLEDSDVHFGPGCSLKTTCSNGLVKIRNGAIISAELDPGRLREEVAAICHEVLISMLAVCSAKGVMLPVRRLDEDLLDYVESIIGAVVSQGK